MKLYLNFILLFQFIYFFLGCSNKKEIQYSITKIQEKHIPDKALEVFDISIQKNFFNKTVQGFTSNPDAFAELQHFSDSIQFEFEVAHLPEPSLGDSIFGIVNVSVTPLREKPSHASQMVDQAIMGYPVKLLRKVEDWYQCQTHYNYVGWINKTAIQNETESGKKNWETSANYRVKQLNSIMYSQPKTFSDPVSDLVLNNKLIVTKKMLKWCEIHLPDGRTGFIQSSHIQKVQPNQKLDIDELLILSKRMMGVPYLWGGNSAKGNDCSGFTQTVFKAQNFQLPRDARQQALKGKQVELYESQPGDLFFFGEGDKVKHVGICVSGKEFIHQGGKVDIHSLDPNSHRYNKYRADTFLFVKRI